MRRFIFVLVLLVTIQVLAASQVVPFSDIFKPKYIFVNQKYFYIIEGFTVNIFNGKDYKLIKKFGKEGEGPQEFKGSVTGLYFPDDKHLVVASLGRISIFTQEGDFVKEVNVKDTMSYDLIPIKDKYFGRTHKRSVKTEIRALNLYDSELSKIKEFHNVVLPTQPGRGIHVFAVSGFVWVHDDKIFVSLENDFLIDVFDDNGNKLYTIKEEKYSPVAVGEVHKNAVYDYFRVDPRTSANFEQIKKDLVFPDHFSAIRDFYAADKKIYVRTYRRENSKTEFYIYGTDGKLIEKKWLPIIERNDFEYGSFLYAILGGKLYQMVEDDDSEVWQLHIDEIR